MELAPQFTLQDQNGKPHSLSDYVGSWMVLYFYPKDNTPGCTLEACSFRDGRDALHALGAEIIGISKGGIASHNKFAEKHKLNYTLLSDPSTETIQAYGSWKKKKFIGTGRMGISRDTFLINPEGKIVKEYRGVNPMSHFKQVYQDLQDLVSLE